MQSAVVSIALSIVQSATACSALMPVRYRPFGTFRFGLAMLVVAQHFQHLLGLDDRALFDRMGFGAIAVAIFFIVSGFVVTEANAVYYVGRPWAFLENRLIRLVPPYLAALALAVAVQAALWRAGALALWDYPHAGAPLTAPRLLAGMLGLVPGLHVLLPDDFEFIPFAWSLRMEMAFYGVVTLVLVGARKWPHAVGLGVMAGLLASLAFLRQGRPGMLSCAPMFLLGVAFCLAVRERGIAHKILLAASLPMAALGFASWGQHGHPVLRLQFLALGPLLVLLCTLATNRITDRWHWLDRQLGDLSYPLYLNHYVVGITLTGVSTMRGGTIYCFGLFSSVCLAVCMGALVDGRLLAVRNRLRQAVLF